VVIAALGEDDLGHRFVVAVGTEDGSGVASSILSRRSDPRRAHKTTAFRQGLSETGYLLPFFAPARMGRPRKPRRRRANKFGWNGGFPDRNGTLPVRYRARLTRLLSANL